MYINKDKTLRMFVISKKNHKIKHTRFGLRFHSFTKNKKNKTKYLSKQMWSLFCSGFDQFHLYIINHTTI